jgi:DNA-binding transcriptional ArsR family regulator
MKAVSMPYHLCLDVLGNPLRIAIIKELEAGQKSVGELSKGLGEEQSKVSHSLAALKKCGFVESKKQGKKTVYRLGKGILSKMEGRNLFEALEGHYREHGCKCWRQGL